MVPPAEHNFRSLKFQSNNSTKPWIGQFAANGRRWYTTYQASAEEAARAVDRYRYKVYGQEGCNFPLTAEQVAELDGLTLEQIEQQFREAGAQGAKFSSGISAYRGVAFDRRNQKWQTNISLQGKYYKLGRSAKQDEAARAYDAAAVLAFGRRAARLNFPKDYQDKTDNDASQYACQVLGPVVANKVMAARDSARKHAANVPQALAQRTQPPALKSKGQQAAGKSKAVTSAGPAHHSTAACGDQPDAHSLEACGSHEDTEQDNSASENMTFSDSISEYEEEEGEEEDTESLSGFLLELDEDIAQAQQQYSAAAARHADNSVVTALMEQLMGMHTMNGHKAHVPELSQVGAGAGAGKASSGLNHKPGAAGLAASAEGTCQPNAGIAVAGQRRPAWLGDGCSHDADLDLWQDAVLGGAVVVGPHSYQDMDFAEKDTALAHELQQLLVSRESGRPVAAQQYAGVLAVPVEKPGCLKPADNLAGRHPSQLLYQQAQLRVLKVTAQDDTPPSYTPGAQYVCHEDFHMLVEAGVDPHEFQTFSQLARSGVLTDVSQADGMLLDVALRYAVLNAMHAAETDYSLQPDSTEWFVFVEAYARAWLRSAERLYKKLSVPFDHAQYTHTGQLQAHIERLQAIRDRFATKECPPGIDKAMERASDILTAVHDHLPAMAVPAAYAFSIRHVPQVEYQARNVVHPNLTKGLATPVFTSNNNAANVPQEPAAAANTFDNSTQELGQAPVAAEAAPTGIPVPKPGATPAYPKSLAAVAAGVQAACGPRLAATFAAAALKALQEVNSVPSAEQVKAAAVSGWAAVAVRAQRLAYMEETLRQSRLEEVIRGMWCERLDWQLSLLEKGDNTLVDPLDLLLATALRQLGESRRRQHLLQGLHLFPYDTVAELLAPAIRSFFADVPKDTSPGVLEAATYMRHAFKVDPNSGLRKCSRTAPAYVMDAVNMRRKQQQQQQKQQQAAAQKKE